MWIVEIILPPLCHEQIIFGTRKNSNKAKRNYCICFLICSLKGMENFSVSLLYFLNKFTNEKIKSESQKIPLRYALGKALQYQDMPFNMSSLLHGKISKAFFCDCADTKNKIYNIMINNIKKQ